MECRFSQKILQTVQIVIKGTGVEWKKNRLHLGKCKATSNFFFPKLYLVNQHTLLRCIYDIVFS